MVVRQERAQLLSGAIGMAVAGTVAGTGIWAGVAVADDAPVAAALWFLALTVLTVTAYVASVVLVVRMAAAARAPLQDASMNRERSSPVRR